MTRTKVHIQIDNPAVTFMKNCSLCLESLAILLPLCNERIIQWSLKGAEPVTVVTPALWSRPNSTPPGSFCTMRWVTDLARNSWPRPQRSTWTIRKWSGERPAGHVTRAPLMIGFWPTKDKDGGDDDCVCVTGIRNASTSLIKSAKGSSRLWMFSRSWRWVNVWIWMFGPVHSLLTVAVCFSPEHQCSHWWKCAAWDSEWGGPQQEWPGWDWWVLAGA